MDMTLQESRAAFDEGRLTKGDYIDERHRRHERLFEYSEYLRHTDIRSIELSDEGVVMTTRADGVRFLCDSKDKRIAPIEILNFGAYEAAEFSVLASLCRPGFRVLDIGANIGWFSLSLWKRCPGVDIRAFEPLPDTYSYLQRNVALNGAQQHVHVNNFGFHHEATELRFYFYPEGSGNASTANLAERTDARLVTCQVKRLDDVIAPDDVVDLIKCDVEGAELYVLQGGMETLARQKPIIFVELLRKWAAKFGYHPNAAVDLLRTIGYACYVITGAGKLQEIALIDDATVATNFLFLHPAKHAGIIGARS